MTEHTERLAYPIPEAAHLIGTSKSTVYRLIDAGRLKSIKIMGRRVVIRESIDQLLLAGDVE